MLAYAAGRQGIAARGSSPSTMLLIIGGHVAVVALAMSAKFIIDASPRTPPTMIDLIETEKIPVPPPPEDNAPPQHAAPKSDPYVPRVPTPMPPQPGTSMSTTAEPTGPTGPVAGTDPAILVPLTPPTPIPVPVRLGPRLATPASALRPPYPTSKLDSQEEASLRLRLTIDERGRVVAVDPVGANDPAFLNAARRHLIAKWRYQPATVDGKTIQSTTVITLRFQLEG
ncbi:hypothetical protein G7077_07305 [Sphingomonas piscis]|uniref:TonB C-terminal domain-containing protein n=1 Tax=Sphingomonas piscis TaxID=2714943 RepID=A0A6G7YPR2_9SPHN|nr:energy transducer TonB [Sphingomonas piscis]QIK78730.1 hypothetical protein G7077_07305 [Sphingomonas piscis]